MVRKRNGIRYSMKSLGFLRMYKQWIPGHFSLLPRGLGMRLPNIRLASSDVIHMMNAPRSFPFFAGLPLLCIIVNANGRWKWRRPGNEASRAHGCSFNAAIYASYGAECYYYPVTGLTACRSADFVPSLLA